MIRVELLKKTRVWGAFKPGSLFEPPTPPWQVLQVKPVASVVWVRATWIRIRIGVVVVARDVPVAVIAVM